MKTFKPNKQLLTTCLIYLISLLTIKSVFAHQQGVIDTHFTVGHSTVKMMYTIPSDQLSLLAQSKDPMAMVSGGFSVLNDEARCKPLPGTTAMLEKIDSQQFFITYKCPQKLGNIKITDELATTDNYKNFTRFSLLGMSKNVVFRAKAKSHEFAVGTVVAMKNVTLKDGVDLQAVNNTSLTWQNFSQSIDYLPVGLEHILLGPDHILFLLGLLLLITSGKSLLVLVTCFTLSHSAALALSVLDIVNLSTDIIEPLIALSIVYVAIENIARLHKAKPGETISHGQYQWLIVTLFGFIHGFGFSFLLKEMGHTHGLLPALTFFNLGVEIGQLLFVIPFFILLNKLPNWLSGQPQPSFAGEVNTLNTATTINMLMVKQYISIMTGLIGLFWLIERTLLS